MRAAHLAHHADLIRGWMFGPYMLCYIGVEFLQLFVVKEEAIVAVYTYDRGQPYQIDSTNDNPIKASKQAVSIYQQPSTSTCYALRHQKWWMAALPTAYTQHAKLAPTSTLAVREILA